MSIARSVNVAPRRLAFVAPASGADEEFDLQAAPYAQEQFEGVFSPMTELQHFGAAAIWARCMERPAGAELDPVTDVADIALGDDRKRLKRRGKALRLAAASAGLRDSIGAALASSEPYGREFPRYERIVRRLVLVSSDTRLLGLESFRAMFGHVVAGSEARADWIMDRIEDQLEALAEAEGADCPFTDPEDPYEGGGWVRVSIGSAPEVEFAGDTGVSFTSPKCRIARIGSDASVRPNVLFELYGQKATKAGAYDVRDRSSSDDAFQRDYAVGSYKIGRDVFWLVSGTLVIDTFNAGKQRRVEGSFDVVGRTDEGAERRLVGTVHLCRFGVEYRDRIDLAD